MDISNLSTDDVRAMDLYDIFDDDLNMCLLCEKYCELTVPRCDLGRTVKEMAAQANG